MRNRSRSAPTSRFLSPRLALVLAPAVAAAALSLAGGFLLAAGPEEKMMAKKAAMESKIDPSILADPARPEDDKKQDAGRKALEVYAWLGIHDGMTVADFFPGGGYNTHLLSRVVGEKGKVYAAMEWNADKEIFGGRAYSVDKINDRIKNGKLTNVTIANKFSDIPANSLDAAVCVRNYHDVEHVFDGWKRKDVVAAMFAVMKPGGVIGIVEVATPKEGWDQETHRLNEKVVIEDFTAGGFKLAGRSDMLANPADDHTEKGFAEGRYNMDRYLLKFQKPEN